MDFIVVHRGKQAAVIGVMVISAVLANLPLSLAEAFLVQREYVLAVFGLLIMLGLFLFAKFSFLLLTALLVVGANLPDRWSLAIQLDKTPLIFALVVMVVGSLLNQTTKIIPVGLEPPKRIPNPEGLKALMAAISRRNERAVRTILAVNISVNMLDDEGRSPLMAAAASGQTEIVELLLAAGANVNLADASGRIAHDFALAAGQSALGLRLMPQVTPAADDSAAPMGTNTAFSGLAKT